MELTLNKGKKNCGIMYYYATFMSVFVSIMSLSSVNERSFKMITVLRWD